jgi:hypothetical protein
LPGEFAQEFEQESGTYFVIATASGTEMWVGIIIENENLNGTWLLLPHDKENLSTIYFNTI